MQTIQRDYQKIAKLLHTALDGTGIPTAFKVLIGTMESNPAMAAAVHDFPKFVLEEAQSFMDAKPALTPEKWGMFNEARALLKATDPGEPLPIMDAVTLWQPWASLVVFGEKVIETRSWRTNFRGRVAIHAAKNDYTEILLQILPSERALFQAAGVCGATSPPRGAVIGMVEIADCLPIEKLYGSRYDTPKERAFGDWRRGRFGWVLTSPVIFQKPIPASGSQGFWKWCPPGAKV